MELTIALAIAGFCLLAVVGLLQTGLTSERDTLDRTVGTDILSRIYQDLTGMQQTNTLSSEFKFDPESTAVQTIWFADASTTNSTAANSRYRASVTFSPPTGSNRTATPARLLVTWPAAADPAGSALPSKYSGSIEVATSLQRR